MAECDESIIAEIISDFSIAIGEKNVVRAYRIIKLLDDYLKGKKCDEAIKERALRILNSLYLQSDEKFRRIIDDAKKVLLKRRRVTKKERKKSKSRRTRRSRRR